MPDQPTRHPPIVEDLTDAIEECVVKLVRAITRHNPAWSRDLLEIISNGLDDAARAEHREARRKAEEEG